MWVKICANTNLADAALAAELGADAAGFVFAPSKRRVTAAQVAAITAQLPANLEKVGVFHAAAFEEITGTVAEARLTAIQLHGAPDEALAERLRGHFETRITLIQTLHWVLRGPDDGPDHEASGDQIARQIERVRSLGVVDRILIDSKIGSAIGGTGLAFDWSAAAPVFAAAPAGTQLIVAGGLNPGNVADAIRNLAPWGVDVASGVEAEPGRKDPYRLRQFIENARNSATK